ncbi:TetR/AcrR family transcriptional regulator [Gordonia sp. TBRC 11910]|uniref:TetR/AcrR family transcriptional regulator n=1 Tax=Gordonia asplenii TaxID=2725283 RepID=A0A848KX15_9ACTN|nr:TetR/AcrR family transcriptional regulator [Gordonia asplenii]NMO03176.1 TetR/AcrR family transcriptional regulator [Gordonia asplenii]
MARIPAAERSADLVAAAVRVIAARGVDGATTRRIAEDANAPLATLHYCFATKELLFAAVFQHVVTEYRDVLARNNISEGLAATARELLRSLLDWYITKPDFAKAALELISWAQRQVDEQAKDVYDEVTQTLQSILADAADGDPTIPPGLIDDLAYVIGAMSDGFAISWAVFGDVAEARKQADILLGVLDAWIAARTRDTVGVTPPPSQPMPHAPKPVAASLVSWVKVS